MISIHSFFCARKKLMDFLLKCLTLFVCFSAPLPQTHVPTIDLTDFTPCSPFCPGVSGKNFWGQGKESEVAGFFVFSHDLRMMFF